MGLAVAQAGLQLELGRTKEAEAAYRALLSLNPDDYDMHAGLLRALRLAPASGGVAERGAHAGAVGATLGEEQRASLAELYRALAAEHPHSSACKRIPLNFLVRCGPGGVCGEAAQVGGPPEGRGPRRRMASCAA